MIFSTEFWGISLLWAVISAVVAGLLASTGSSSSSSHRGRGEGGSTGGAYGLTAGLVSFGVSLLLVRILMYYMLPSFQGSFFGYWPVLFCALTPAAIIGLIFSQGNGKAITACLVGALALFGVPTVQYIANAWGGANLQRFADLPNIRVAGQDEKIPPTDPDHMVQVTKSIAQFKGQSALTTQPGIASRYSIDKDEYVLQFVAGHRYWIAPLTLINTADTWNWDDPVSPGYVVVDAEDPEKDATLKLGYEIKLFSNQSWGLNLQRWVYLQGYSEGILDEPIFEVDDNWQPYWTIGYIKRPFGDITGKKMEKVLAVNVSKRTPVLTAFDLDKKPEWIDRVMSDDLVKEYATDWGWYSGEFARQHWMQVAFGFNKTGTMEPAELELAYTKDAHNAWVVPMTTTSEGDHAVVGVLVFETGENKATYYPGLKGFNVGSSVVTTMENARDNIKHYKVESVQLYSIYGELTWVAIYSAPQSIGTSFGGIGILHAHSQNAADVVFANDKATALRLYATQLARANAGGGTISQTAHQSKEIAGRIKRIALLPSSQMGGAPTYMFIIAGDNHIFIVSRDTYSRIPLVKEGDEVVFTYLDTNSTETAVNAFKCKVIDDFNVEAPADKK